MKKLLFTIITVSLVLFISCGKVKAQSGFFTPAEFKLKVQGGFSIANNFGLFTSVDYFFKPNTFFGIEMHTTALMSQKSESGITVIDLPQDQYTSYMVTVGKLHTNPNNNKQHVNLKFGLGVVYYDKIIDYIKQNIGPGGFGFFSTYYIYDPIRESGMTFGMTLDASFQKIGNRLGFMIGPYLNLNLDRPYASFKIGLIIPMRK